MNKKLKFETLHIFDTEYPADSIEWCPHPDFQSYFACGTYHLEESNDYATSCQRKGRIYLLQFDTATESLKEVQRLETAAILDMKWLQELQRNATLATVNAVGEVDMYTLENGTLKALTTLHLNPDCTNLLALSLDWRLKHPELTPQILVSDSQGCISLIDYLPSGDLNVEKSWSAHGFEAWICAFDKWNEQRFYTGGDDCLLSVYDLRTNVCVLNNKSHTAGVTCLLSHPKQEHVLLTGSYDERLRIFDTRTLKQPLGEVNLGGGIWRLKCDAWDRNLILAACMYKNFSIIQLDMEQLGTGHVVAEYDVHASICYGADWGLNSQKGNGKLYTATCSFYDHKLCIAKVLQDEM